MRALHFNTFVQLWRTRARQHMYIDVYGHSNSKLTSGVSATWFLHFTLKTKLCSTKQEILLWSLCKAFNTKNAQWSQKENMAAMISLMCTICTYACKYKQARFALTALSGLICDTGWWMEKTVQLVKIEASKPARWQILWNGYQHPLFLKCTTLNTLLTGLW